MILISLTKSSGKLFHAFALWYIRESFPLFGLLQLICIFDEGRVL